MLCSIVLELFAHYIAGKPLAQCSVTLLSKDLHCADLLIEIQEVSRDPAISERISGAPWNPQAVTEGPQEPLIGALG